MSDADIVGLFEDLSRVENTAELSEGRMLRFIMRSVSPHISDGALRVLLFIFDRTYTYGKTAEVISIDHFLKGVTWENTLLHPPIKTSRTALYRDIKELSDNVIILRKTDFRAHRTSYMINPIWSPNFVIPARNVTKAKSLAQNTGGLSQIRDGGVPNTGQDNPVPETLREQEDSNMGNITGSAVPASLTSLVSNVSAKSADRRATKKGKGNATAFALIWQDAFKEAYPEETFFAWRVTELASFKRALQRGAIPQPVIPNFINFVVSEFSTVIAERFGWMRDPPSVPNVGFVVKNVEKFYQAFLDKDDPNRKVRGRIARGSAPEAPAPAAGHDQLKKLQDQLDAERAKRERAEREANELKAEKSSAERKAVKRLVLKRKTSSPEFGEWEE